MIEQVYKDMVGVMARRGMVFGGRDIPEFYKVVELLFTPEEAAINNAMPPKPFTAVDLAEKLGRDEAEMADKLKSMAEKGLCISYQKDGARFFQAAPFMPGIFEFVLFRGFETNRDRQLAQAIHEYKEAWEAESPIVIPYPMQRVITVNKTVEAGNEIHTYDQIKTYIEENNTIAVGTCYCRQGAKLRGEDTHDMPMQTCMFLGRNAEFGIESLGAKSCTKEEALKILDECEEAGLVHMTSNTLDGVGYICNCDRWHCFAVKMALKQPHPAMIFNSGFEPIWDKDLCTACGTCIDRCPAVALEMGGNDLPEVDLNRCFGCAVCATGCPEEAIKMKTKPGSEAPPKDQNALMTAMMQSFSKKK
jgi:Pyruvate/2-oxoacid:ferredoxin oxidoreductase delta subunit